MFIRSTEEGRCHILPTVGEDVALSSWMLVGELGDVVDEARNENQSFGL